MKSSSIWIVFKDTDGKADTTEKLKSSSIYEYIKPDWAI